MDDLVAWKNSPGRKPLVLSGVRQSGKTTILKRFGEEHYAKTVYVNLEKDIRYRGAFDNLDTDRIITHIASISRTEIGKGDTLIILDEIQSLPVALTSLKYFSEENPEYHIACAGSLLGIELAKSSSKPVGQTDLMRMWPLDFHEWVVANGYGALWDDVARDPMGMSEDYSRTLEDLYRTYLFVGGMPAAVDAWVKTHSESEVVKAQEQILKWYDSDMLRYAPKDDSDKILQVWDSITSQLCTETGDFIFSHVRKGGRARELEGSLQWLVDAGLVNKVCKIGRPSVPLAMQKDNSTFKIYLCDVGLMGRMMQLDMEAYIEPDTDLLSDGFRGAVAENFVLNELLHGHDDRVYFWRDGKYEVDFIIQYRSRAFPVEVKSGRKVRTTSLTRYIDLYGPTATVILSLNLPERKNAFRLPLYLASLVDRALDEAIAGLRV